MSLVDLDKLVVALNAQEPSQLGFSGRFPRLKIKDNNFEASGSKRR